MKKRLLAILLSLMMVLSLLPVGVFAADAEGIGTGDELAKLFTEVKAGAAGSDDVTVTIDKDYNLTGYNWTSLTVDGYHGAGIVTVEGNNHTITGLNAPLFAGGFAGTSGIVIKNLTLTKVNVNDTTSNQGIGAFINNVDSMPKIELDNCHLTDSTITSTGGARVGGLIGWTSGYNKKDDGPVDTYIIVKNCSVENTAITANGSVGGIIGHAGCNAATFHTFTDNTVTGCTLKSTDNGDWRVGVVVGTANVGEISIANTTESNNTTDQTGKTAPEGQSDLYGRFVPGTTGELVIDGVAVFNSDIVAAIGNTGYKTLADAVTAAQDGDTITLLKDTIGSGIGTYKDPGKDLQGNDQITAKGFTIDFNQHTYSVDKPAVGSKTFETQGFHFEWKGAVDTTPNITLKNGTLNVAKDHDPNLKLLVQNYCNLTLDNMTVDGTNLTKGWGSYTYVTSNCNGTVTIKDSAIISENPNADVAFDVDGARRGYGPVKLTIEGDSKISGKFEVSTNEGNSLTVKGGYFTSDPSSYKAADRYVVASDVDGYTYMVTATAPTDDQKITVVDKTNASVDSSITGDDKNAIDSAMNSGKTNVDGVAEAVSTTVKTGIVNDAKDKANNVPAGEVTSTEIEVKVNVSVTEANLNKGTMTFAAVPVATVKVNDTELKNADGDAVEVPISNAMLNGKPITVKLPLPTVNGKLFTPKQIKHTSADGSVEYFLDHSENGARVFKIENDCAVFTITKFSTFELSGTQTYVAPVYTSAPITKKDVKFDDVDVNAYYAPAVKWAVENKITAGKTDKLFAPDDTCTRGEMITFLWNAAGKPAAKNTTNPFTDVNAGAFYYDAVLWAVSNGITSGTTDTTFSPDNTVNRAQVVAFLYNYANKPAAANSTFSDVAADAYYAPAVGWAAAQKITSGTGNNTFSPENDCTRAQIVTFLYNDLAK